MRVINFFILSVILLLLSQEAESGKPPAPGLKGSFKKSSGPSIVELQADQMSFNASVNQATAEGHVVVKQQDQILYCDRLLLYRTIQKAVAQGHVYLDTPQENVIALELIYNFHDRTGTFRDARVYAYPYQIKGRSIAKVAPTHMVMDRGFMTTCDLDQPHFRMAARRMDVYQKDKAIMRHMRIYLGNFPVMYMPYYSHDLAHRPLFTIQPGKNKEFGFFLLTRTHFTVGSHIKVTLHADIRERTGFGEGYDIKYMAPHFGNGLLTAYYTAENMIASKHRWGLYNDDGSKVGPTAHQARFRFRWRHQWQVAKNTSAIWQVYKIHDKDILNSDGHGFLQNYFPRENQQNADLNTYFLLTHVMPRGTLTFNINDTRVNRPLRGVDRFPEIIYTLNNQPIGQTGFYAKSVNTYSNLSLQNYPKTFNNKTERFDTNNDISRPFKMGFVSLNPHVGGEHTFYSRTADIEKKEIVRGLFRTSLDMSTKFYRIWRDVHTNFAGMDIHGLRHMVTPTVTYVYQSRPTFPPTELNQFDSIDNLYRVHQIAFGWENKWQTKRGGATNDLLRILAASNFGLPTTTGRRGFNPPVFTTDFSPNNWFTLHDESEYDTHLNHINSDNISGTIHFEKWSLSLGSFYTRTQSDLMSVEILYHINPKWSFRSFDSFPLTRPEAGAVYRQNNVNPISNMTGLTETSSFSMPARGHTFILTRDLHEWQMDFMVDAFQKRGIGFYVIFRLKAFPGMNVKAGGVLLPEFPGANPGSQQAHP